MNNQSHGCTPSRVTALLLLTLGAACEDAPHDDVAAAQAALTVDDAALSSGSKIDWEPCERERLTKAGAVCGMLAVPLNHDRPHGAKIQLALSMIKHAVPDDQYQGIMLANPGGPGGSGRGLSVLGQYVPNDAGLAYDWIGFDPRGVGASVPALSCIEDYLAGPRPQFVPVAVELEQTWLQRSERYATACGENGGELLEHIRTTDVVQDMDLIRAALHAPQLNFYGLSYGTYLGQVYATTFPHRVRRMVLDSNVDPTRVFYEANLDQDSAFQHNIESFWRWVAEYDAVYKLGATQHAVEKAWYAEQHKLGDAPAGGVVGADEWTDIFLASGYSQGAWPGLAKLWVDWLNDADPAPVVAQYEGADSPTDDNTFAVYNAVQCTDAVWPRSWSTWRSDNWATFRQAPFETWANAWFNAPCLYWPAKPSAAVEVNGEHVAPILLLGETLDAATPFNGTLEVRRRFPNASLIASPGGTTHASSLSGNSCVDDQIAAYLSTGELPPRQADIDQPDAVCDPLPLPEPEQPATYAFTSEDQRALRRELLQIQMHRHVR
jgi:pimeloyl-ACP methyl ester carboxylesterase